MLQEELVEISSELAHDRAVEFIKYQIDNDIEIYKNKKETEYSEEFQSVFDNFYDYYYNQLEKFVH